MGFNLLVVPTLVFALLLFGAGRHLFGRLTTRNQRLGLFAVATMFAVPGLLMALYYLHLFDRAMWYYEFRALPYAELSAAGLGLAAGILAVAGRERRWPTSLLPVLLCLTVFAPFSKPILAPLPPDGLRDRWEDGICLQSTPSSCGAASAATLLRHLGRPATETEIARECFTYRGGTENWYLAWALRRRGLTVRFRMTDGFSPDLRLPAIAGVRVGRAGHFIAVLEGTNLSVVTGDPLVGRQEHTADALPHDYEFTGFFMEVSR